MIWHLENQNIFPEGTGQADRQRTERVTDLPVGSSVVPLKQGRRVIASAPAPVSPAPAFFKKATNGDEISRQHARVDELHTRIGCQPIFDARFPRSSGRHDAANLSAGALSSYNLRNPRTIINHWAFD
jgi:hypothetical protein